MLFRALITKLMTDNSQYLIQNQIVTQIWVQSEGKQRRASQIGLIHQRMWNRTMIKGRGVNDSPTHLQSNDFLLKFKSLF